jgi:lysophospholipase L1-like esterase
MKVMMQATWLALLILVSFGASAEVPLYAQAPPGQGVNGDWAFLGRYQKENASLAPDGTRVVFLGDSITQDWASHPFISKNAHYVGRGISGQTTLQLLVRFRADVIDLRPKLVHIMAGTNDIAGNNGPESDAEIEDAIRSMVELALANHIQVLLASIPPAQDFNWHPNLSPAPRIRRINAWLRSYASQPGVSYADYWSALATSDGSMKPGLAADGVHPNEQCYERMAPIAAAAIESALKAHAGARVTRQDHRPRAGAAIR